MQFQSITFLFFFAAVGVLFFILPQRFRWVVLLGSSYLFYLSGRPESIILLAALTWINYHAAIQMGRKATIPERRKFLLLALFSNLGLLVAFKYFNFIGQALNVVFEQGGVSLNIPVLDLFLPVGISFFTFKNLSYAIDVYRGNIEPERHLGVFALYIAFFPQLLAGPIERATRLLPQFHKKMNFDERRITGGLRLILWGLFQKMVVADNLAALVDPVYNHPGQYPGVILLAATLLFAFQIYYDFSGYSDIAIGAARVLGYETMENFNQPYLSGSISEFWRRWHISLSTWFRDYLYIPLGGNRVSAPRRYLNLLIVFILCGFWHGANWTFVFWGGLHGLYLIVSNATEGVRGRIVEVTGLARAPRIHRLLKWGITFSLVCFAWIFFRANRLSEAFFIATHLFSGVENLFRMELLRTLWASLPSGVEWIFGVVALGLGEAFRVAAGRKGFREGSWSAPAPLRWAVYYGMLIGILLFGQFEARPFIYFQF
jgi:D-alanyl-lipoteichoic acid acyltransferase DltB (MBOAT superfamily)